MSFFPGKDLIVDVARAADPVRRDLATRRLAELSRGAEGARMNFAAVAPPRVPGGSQPAAHAAPAPAMTQRLPASDPMRKFEAFVLQSFLELVLPKETDALYGHGVAGGIWRSMMAEHMAARIVEAGGLGLGKTLAHGAFAPQKRAV